MPKESCIGHSSRMLICPFHPKRQQPQHAENPVAASVFVLEEFDVDDMNV